jgi:hypothetical protein
MEALSFLCVSAVAKIMTWFATMLPWMFTVEPSEAASRKAPGANQSVISGGMARSSWGPSKSTPGDRPVVKRAI